MTPRNHENGWYVCVFLAGGPFWVPNRFSHEILELPIIFMKFSTFRSLPAPHLTHSWNPWLNPGENSIPRSRILSENHFYSVFSKLGCRSQLGNDPSATRHVYEIIIFALPRKCFKTQAEINDSGVKFLRKCHLIRKKWNHVGNQ